MKEDKIKQFLNPKTIAVIGASDNPNKVGNILIKKLKSFKGKTIPINKKHEKIEGLKTYKSILKFPKQIDLVIIATPSKTVGKILKECVKKQIKNIIIISSGFSEIKNYKLDKQIKKLKLKHEINILGPNCFGIFNPTINLDTTFAKETPKKGDIAVISQSGALWSYMADLDLNFSGFVSLGNMSDLNFSDFIEYFNKDKKTKKIILYVEKIKQGKRFIEICKKSKKPIYVIKAGQTKKGKQAALSHTGSLAVDSEIYSAAFRQAKIKETDSITKALGLKKQNISEHLHGKKILILTNAGGAGTILTDKLTKNNYKVYGPKDLLGTAQPQDYNIALNRIKNNYDKIIVILTPQTMSNPELTAKVLTQSIHKNKIIALFLGDKSMTKAIKILKEARVPVFTKGV